MTFAAAFFFILAAAVLFLASEPAQPEPMMARERRGRRAQAPLPPPSPLPPTPPSPPPAAPPPSPPVEHHPVGHAHVGRSRSAVGAAKSDDASPTSSDEPEVPKAPVFCARNPPGKDGKTGFTCMEHKCWPGEPGQERTLSCAQKNGIEDTWGTGFFHCMCACCGVPCKIKDGCNATMMDGTPPDFDMGFPYRS
jgi:hypothetical protein